MGFVMHDLVIHALAAAAVVDFLKAFEGEREGNVAESLQILAELLVNQRPVREDMEFAVMLVAYSPTKVR